VLLLTDGVDEWVVNHLTEFQGKPLQSVTKGDLDLGKLEDEQEKEAARDAGERYRSLIERVRQALGDKVKEVRLSHRLTSSPACLVAGEYEMGRHMEQLLKAAGQSVSSAKPVLELNPEHPLVRRLDGEQDAGRFGEWAHLLLDQALLAEGGQLEDPAGFVRRLNEILLRAA
jgi:molecular chaperone HtpG